MKRLIKIVLILAVLLLAAAFILPIVFKDQITQKAKVELNNNLNAEANFESVGVNLFSAFPNFLVSLEQLTIDGQGEFEGLRLLELADFELELDLLSVIMGKQFQIESITAKNTTVNIRVTPDGQANYDIVKQDSTETNSSADNSSAAFALSLKNYALENFNLNYVDEEGKLMAYLKNLNHTGKGDFTQAEVALETSTQIEELTFIMDEVAYLNKVNAKSDLDLVYNQTSDQITLGDNHVDFNDLVLNFTGDFTLPDTEGNMPINLSFNAPEANFKSLLSLIPVIYTQDFGNLTAGGNFSLSGMAKGTYEPNAELYPAFDLTAKVENGNFKYPSLPAGVEQVALQMQIVNKTNKLDDMRINVPVFKAMVGNSPFEGSFNLATPISDPNFDLALKANLALANLAKVVPTQGYNYAGQLMADFSTRGKLSAIEAEQYEEVQAQGYIKVKDLSLSGDSLPMPISIPMAEMSLSPQKASLKQFSAQFGQSDVNANGSLNNLMGYALNDELLQGSFSLSGKLLNLTELGSEEEPSSTSSETNTSQSNMTIIRLPQNLDLGLVVNYDSLVYDDMTLTNFKGGMAIKEGAAQLDNLKLNGLGGKMALSGIYDSKPTTPAVNFDLKLQNLGFKESYQHLNLVQQLAPIMKNTIGNFSAGFKFKSGLNPDMTPDLSTAMASGVLTTSQIKTEAEALTKIAEAIKNPDLAVLQLAGLDVDFKLENGRLTTAPFDIKADQIKGTVQGSSGLDKSLDYVMHLALPTSSLAQGTLGNAINAAGPLNVDINIGGTFTKPTITTSLGSLVNNLAGNLKNQAKAKIDEGKEKATQAVNDKAQNLVAQAEKKGDELIAAAEAQARKIKNEAAKQAQRIKDEAYRRADKLEEEAKGNLIKEAAARTAAKRVKSDADKQAKNVTDAANKQATDLVNNAKAQKKKLVDEAKAKAQI